MTSEERREAREWFKDQAKRFYGQGSYEMYRRAIEALSEDWISVSDRLPDKDGKYCVYCAVSFDHAPDKQGELFYSKKHRTFGKWSYHTYGDGSYDKYFVAIKNCVTAWRELPPDYEGE